MTLKIHLSQLPDDAKAQYDSLNVQSDRHIAYWHAATGRLYQFILGLLPDEPEEDVGLPQPRIARRWYEALPTDAMLVVRT